MLRMHDRGNFPGDTGRRDLAQKYAYLSERLHGDVFYAGASVTAEMAGRYLDEVEDYIRKISTL